MRWGSGRGFVGFRGGGVEEEESVVRRSWTTLGESGGEDLSLRLQLEGVHDGETGMASLASSFWDGRLFSASI